MPEEDRRHYALSVPLYTHFTSPIRRYADVMVHRLLEAAQGYADRPKWDVEDVHRLDISVFLTRLDFELFC